MRKTIHSLILLILLCIAAQSQERSFVALDELLLSAGQYSVIPDNRVPVLNLSTEYDKEKHKCKPGGIVVGSLLLSGGVAVGITGQILGKKIYSKYQQSAFTENTDKLRERMVKYNSMRIIGGVCAGTGFFILIFSF